LSTRAKEGEITSFSAILKTILGSKDELTVENHHVIIAFFTNGDNENSKICGGCLAKKVALILAVLLLYRWGGK